MPQDERQIVTSLLSWFRRHGRDLPWRRTRDPYALWVAEIMLQQTQVKTVIAYWNRWMEVFPDIQTLAAADLDDVLKEWAGLGYYRRARHLHQAAQIIARDYGGSFPTEPKEVRKLPGIGRYTAGAICSQAFDRPAPILDGNVTRVLSRLYDIQEPPSRAATNATLWELAERLVLKAAASPRKTKSPHCSHLNQALMELGATVCTPASPQCPQCPVADVCVAYRNGITHLLPALKPRPTPTKRRFASFLVTQDGQWLVRQRPENAVNAGLWEFPNVELTDGSTAPEDAAKHLFKAAQPKVRYLGKIRHNITRYKITTEVYEIEIDSSDAISPDAGQWHPRETLRNLAFPSAHQKIRDGFVLPQSTQRLI